MTVRLKHTEMHPIRPWGLRRSFPPLVAAEVSVRVEFLLLEVLADDGRGAERGPDDELAPRPLCVFGLGEVVQSAEGVADTAGAVYKS
jgi:hypothetical protein